LEDGGEEVVERLRKDLGPLLLEVGREHVIGFRRFDERKS
jgi:hypothetical protein